MIKIKYVFQRGDTCYWQRKIPTDLLDRYPTSGTLKLNLKTLDPGAVATKVAKLNREYEALWAAMRKDPTLTPVSARGEAKKLLKGFGIAADGRSPDEFDLDGFFDHIEGKRQRYADRQSEPEEAYHFAPEEAYLSNGEIEAVRMLKGSKQFLLSDAIELYLTENNKNGQAGFAKLDTYTRRVWAKLIELLGDKVFVEVTRDDARAFRDKLMASMKTTSVCRCLNVIAAVFESAIREKPIKNHETVWGAVPIKGEGKDAEKRETLDAAQMDALRAKCSDLDDDIRWALSIQLDAGTRIAEVMAVERWTEKRIHIHGRNGGEVRARENGCGCSRKNYGSGDLDFNGVPPNS